GLLTEMEELQSQGIDTSRLYISERAHVVMPYHFLLDRFEEEARGADKIGSTQRGISPAYVDKHARIGIRMADLLDVDAFRAKLAPILQQKNRMLTQIYGQPPLSLEEIHGEYFRYGQHLRPLITDTQTMLHEALFERKTILLEGAQEMRDRGHEYGTNTGRARRCGWFDAVAGRFVAQLNGLNAAVITKLDVLDTFPTIKICTAYQLHGKLVHSLPATQSDLAACE